MKQTPLSYTDYLVSGEVFTLKEVKQYPGMLQTTPTPNWKDLPKYYESDEYISHSNKVDGLMSWVYFQVKKFNLSKKATLIEGRNTHKRILDYGCGTGDFVKYLDTQNVNAFGYEPNPYAFAIAKSQVPGKIYNAIDFLDNEKFDVITLWHVLEHIPNLHEIIGKLKNALTPSGKLYIALPNYKSYDAQFYQTDWAAYDVPRHLWHFDQCSFHTLMNEFGMIIESTYPMIFDAFYVSLLSEKYKKTPLGFLRAFAIGLVSNLKAQKTGEFSSLIYQAAIK